MNDKDWRQEYKGMRILNKRQKQLLDEGAKSLSQSWILQAMYNDWKRKKGIKDDTEENTGQLNHPSKNLSQESINQQSINHQKKSD